MPNIVAKNPAACTKITAATLACLVLLSGCATMSKQECQIADWQAVGQRDGSNGRSMDYILNHAKACGRINIVPNKTQWEIGRQQGLKLYCTPSNAYNVGSQGKSLNLVCPTDNLTVLQQANQKGLRVYELTQQINKDKTELDKYVEEYRKMRDGSNLHFKTEKEARAYLLRLPDKIATLRGRIEQNQYVLQSIRGW